jgi:hypothetical protein
MRKREIVKKENLLLIFLFLILIEFGFVLATAPSWKLGSSTTNYTTNEDSVYYHNLSENISGYSNDVNFSIDTDSSIYWTNASGRFQINELDILDWIRIYNPDTGNLTINASNDLQTGFFEIPIQATNTSDKEFTGTIFEFIINATNDAPEFISNGINNSYNLTQSENFLIYLNASDEELHYPLSFNVSFWNNCTHAPWSGRNTDENCSLFDFDFNITDLSDNISAIINFTPSRNDVGNYWLNISVRDSGENYLCPSKYCDNNSYQQNKTTVYSEIIKFQILSYLEINASDCQNKIFNESEENTCYINITTRGVNSNLTLQSIAELRNYNTPEWINESWFYGFNNSNADDYSLIVYINVTPDKKEIGNWTINFTVEDNDYNQTESELIYIFVNKTISSSPNVNDIEDINTSVNFETTINFNITDDDFLIPDKNVSYGGFNESLRINYTILNQSDLNQELVFSNFTFEIINNPVDGTNRTEARFVFTPSLNESGNYTINVSVFDNESNFDFDLFNLTVKSNSYPIWIFPLATNFSINEDDNLYLNLSENVSDSDGDSLTFSYSFQSGYDFPSFEENFNTSTGEINITPSDADVGLHWVNISVSDGYLVNETSFNFTVNNVHDSPSFNAIRCENGTKPEDNDALINATEDNITKIDIYIQDNDFNIPSIQADNGFYQENLSVVNTTVINISDGNLVEDFLNFSFLSFHPSDDTISIYRATFQPNKTYLGQYNITFYFNDSSGNENNHFFVLNINEISHTPSLGEVENFSIFVNESIYFDFNATDIEDINDSLGNFTFNISFILGSDFINENESIFNTTSGILNKSFNDSQAGKYHLNITVYDSSNLSNSKSFWIYVYDSPYFISPVSNYTFNLTENQTSLLDFKVNHSVGDNLTYELWIDSINCSYQNNSNCNYGSLILRENLSSYGNNSNFSWSFRPNFSDESYGNLKNLTVKVYASSNSLNNNTIENFSINRTFKLNISHTNYPVAFIRTIDNKGPVAYTSDIEIDLLDYFIDYDYFDSYYYYDYSRMHSDAEISFTSSGNSTYITSAINSQNDWEIIFSSSSADEGLFIINASSSSSNISSNYFFVEFTNPTTVPEVIYSSKSKKVEVPILLKLVLPGEISLINNDTVFVPIALRNEGKKVLSGINLSGFITKDSILNENFNISFSNSTFSQLKVNEQINLTMIVKTGLVEEGTYELTVNATVKNPKYHDWGKIFVKVEEVSKIKERLLFTSDFILENPQCAELTEIVNEAIKLFEEKNFDLALKTANEAVDACKQIIYSSGRFRIDDKSETKFYKTVSIFILSIFAGMILFYYYRKFKVKRGFVDRKDLSNKDYIYNKKEI